MGDEPVPQITNSVRGAVGNKFVDFLPAEEADFRLLYSFAVHRKRQDFKERFFDMLKQDAGKYEKVAFIPQIVNDRGEGAFEFRVKMKGNPNTAKADISVGISGLCF